MNLLTESPILSLRPGGDDGDDGPATTVIIPTYRRSGQLIECLDALSKQTLKPAQVIVVVRNEDTETREALAGRRAKVEIVEVDRPGQVYALNSALLRARGEIVAFTDDDAVPGRDWLRKLTVHYADPMVGGVGGKVIVPRLTEAESGNHHLVGRVSVIGRPLGNHHLGDGPARDVDWLKGVNMSFRRELCRFDESLRGPGAQVANDSEIALRVRAGGWRVIYDPAASVDHFAGPRFDGDGRDRQTIQATRDAVFNETLVLLRWLPRRRVRTYAYLLLIGVPRGSGPLGAIKAVVTRRRRPIDALRNCRHATAARFSALATFVRGSHRDLAPAPPVSAR